MSKSDVTRETLWKELTEDERDVIIYGHRHGGLVYDGGTYGPECGTLVSRGLVGKYEIALTLAGHALAHWVTNTRPTPSQGDPA